MSRLEGARAALARADEKLVRLREVQPWLIDLSLRENPVGARVGQTLEDKLALLPRLRAFGFTDILLGTLDYAMPEEHEVDDDFIQYLRDHDPDQLRGGWAFVDLGDAVGEFSPSPSMVKAATYGVPNVLLEIYLAPQTMPYPFSQLQAWLPSAISWLLANLRRIDGQLPQILINIVDGCDAFYANSEQTLQILQMMAADDAIGVSFEDDRGTYFPFQVGAYVAAARQALGPSKKLLVHMHAGGGFENASLIEALLEGADGVWGGLPKRAAIIGHASLGELIANLVRAGNASMSQYQLTNLIPLAAGLEILDDQDRVPDDLPILGTNAYRTPLSFFTQIAGRAQDLVPSVIGGTQQWRICPVVSDQAVIAGRLAEVIGPRSFDPDVLTQMIRLMRQALRGGDKIAWDEPEALRFLYEQAGGT